LGTRVLSLRSLRRRRNRSRRPCRERRFPARAPGNCGSHVGPNEPRFDRQFTSRPIAARRLLLPRGRSRLPRSLSGIQTSRPRPVPSPDSRTGSGAGATRDRSHDRSARPSARASIRRACLDPPLRHLPQSRKGAPVFSRTWRVARALLLECPGGRHPAAIGRPVVSPPPAGTVPGADASGHRRSYDVTGGAPAQHSRRGPCATPRRPSSARTSTWTSAQRQRIVT